MNFAIIYIIDAHSDTILLSLGTKSLNKRNKICVKNFEKTQTHHKNIILQE